MVHMPTLEAELSVRRHKIAELALAPISLNPCPLEGISHPEYVDGTATAAVFKGSLGSVSDVGTAAGDVNCDLAKCSPKYDRTAPFTNARTGRIDVAVGSDWQLGAPPLLAKRLVTVATGSPALSYADPETSSRVMLSLLGCRAAPVVTAEDLMLPERPPAPAPEPSPPPSVSLLQVQERRGAAAADAGASMLRTNRRLSIGAGASAARSQPADADALDDAAAAAEREGMDEGAAPLIGDGTRFAAAAAAGRGGSAGKGKGQGQERQALPPETPHRRRTARGLPLLHVGCFEVNCTASALQYLFCSPLPSQQQGEDADQGGPPPGSTPLREAIGWSADINYASQGLVLPARYEILSKVALAPPVASNSRRPREKGYLETNIYREAWVLSFLAALPLAGATPHLPLLLEVLRCGSLPDTMTMPPAQAIGKSGALPGSAPGAVALGVSRSIAAAGSSFQWGAAWTDTAQSDLATVLDAYSLPALPGAWFRGILFQLLYTLAVARHSFGLHHNGLLSLRNIKVQQVPHGSPAHRAYTCYTTTGQVIAGIPLRVRSQADRNAWVSGRSASGALDFLYEPDPSKSDTDACVRARRAEKARAARAAAGLPAAPPPPLDGSGPSFNPVPIDDRTSWCVAAADVDGLRVKLHNFEASSLVRKQLEWWAEGHAFPNTAWRDDLKDLAAVFCAVAAEKVMGFERYAGGAAKDLCAQMAAGAFARNPAAALRHALFAGFPQAAAAGASASSGSGSGSSTAAGDDAASKYAGLPPLDAVQSWQRALYSYAPLTIDAEPLPAASPAPQPAAAAAAAAAGVTPSPSPPARYPDDAPVSRWTLLDLLRPGRPWLVHRDSLSASVAWHVTPLPPWLAKVAPQERPTFYGAFVNGRSAYTGPATTYRVELPSPAHQVECLRVQVAAYYPSFGWTHRSEPLEMNDCSAAPALPTQ